MPTPDQPPATASSPSTKGGLRQQILARRRLRTPQESRLAADRIATHVLAWEAVRRTRTVAAYVSLGSEPGTHLLLDELRASGFRVLLPVLLDDFDLDWASYEGPSSLAPAGRGLLEPSGDRLGVAAIADVGVVLVPGLAVSAGGDRLGRGGGCYDRALARVPGGVPIGVLLHHDEVGLDVPTEAHDRRVTHAITPEGLVELTG